MGESRKTEEKERKSQAEKLWNKRMPEENQPIRQYWIK